MILMIMIGGAMNSVLAMFGSFMIQMKMAGGRGGANQKQEHKQPAQQLALLTAESLCCESSVHGGCLSNAGNL
ncbi:hypothetical protein QP938_02550 [Porticoccaceae bacterium LTM1]|nr:hypothetical protein QP938_02550 [Porticoccaceae bacterium LTM1]